MSPARKDALPPHARPIDRKEQVRPPDPVGSPNAGTAARYYRHLLAAICLLALAVRLVILTDYVAHNPFAQYPIADAETYWNWAGQIAAGNLVGDTPFFSAPLYPYLLGLLRAWGGGLTTVYVTQLIAHLGTGLLIAWIGRRRFGPGVGLAAAALFFALADPTTYTTRPLNCTLQLLVLCLFWMQVIRAQEHPSLRRWCWAGALCGLLVLCFAPALLLLLGLAPWVYARSRSARRRLLIAVLPVGAGGMVISPALLHNYAVTGEIHNVQASAYINMAQGYGPGAYGVYTPLPQLTADRTDLFQSAAWAFQTASGRPGTWREINAHYRHYVLDFLRENPAAGAALALKKLTLFLTARDYDDIIPPKFEAQGGRINRLALAPLATPWLMGPALIGLWSRRRPWLRSAPEWALLLLPLVVVVIFMYTPRYRLPVVPILCVAAAVPVVYALQTRSPRAWGTLVMAGAVAVCGEAVRAVSQLDAIESGRSQAATQLALAFERADRRDQAVDLLEKLCRYRPDDVRARLILADMLARDRKLDQAIQTYRQVLRLKADQPRAHTNLGLLLNMRGRLEDLHAALEHFRAPAAVPRQAAKNHHGAGMVLEKLGRLDQAATEYRRAVGIDPSNWRAWCDLANLLARTGRLAEAATALDNALRHPDLPDRVAWEARLTEWRRGDQEPPNGPPAP